MKIVTLYTKKGCHLCEAVEKTIAQIARRKRFHFNRRDICEDAGDFERYQHDIPVILVDGNEIARHHLAADELIRALG